MKKHATQLFMLCAFLLVLMSNGQFAQAFEVNRARTASFSISDWWGGSEVTELTFDDMYGSVSSLGLGFSDMLANNEGNTVRMIGFMAPPLTPTINFFVLTREPMSICPFCSSDADWPPDIVVVKMPYGIEALPYDAPISVTGTLELGSEVDEETGFVSLVRIVADNVEAL